MKKFILLLILSLIPALVLAEETVRTWTTSAGKEMVGVWEMEKDTDEEKIHIRSNGKLFRVAVKKLSEADQTYITEKRTASRSMDDDAFEEVEETETGSSDRGVAIVEKGNRYALLIGVNQYVKPIRSLRFCTNDMKTLAESFQKIGVPKENIFLMTDDSELERRPTRANIMRQIESITRLMGEGDQLTIAFSGHGVMVDGKSYLCPSDTDLENRDSIVSRDWAFEQLEKCAARQKIFIVDACRDEVAFGGSKGLGGAKTLDDPIGAETHGFVLIASCDREQQSWEDETLEHGVFTHFLAEGLAGAAGDEDGYVSILDLFQYASRKTKKYVFREFNRVQVPTFRQGSEMTEFILAKLETAPEPEVRKAGERMVKTVDGIEYAFRWCPAGSFLMGSPSSESNRESGETQHSVTLTRGFWMLETEVTQAMWKSVMGTSISQQRDKKSTSWPLIGEGSDYPMYYVSWEECRSFCEKLSEKLGLTVSLPTEAQWEYACRADTTSAYAGDLGEMGWYVSNSGSKTHPVGQKKPNAWGLYDMHGNVYEWCQDRFGSYFMSPTSDPTGPNSGSYRVNRGGSWNDFAQNCRSAYRHGDTPDGRGNFLGFRIVLAAPAASISEPVPPPGPTEESTPETTQLSESSGSFHTAGERMVKTVDGIEYAFRWCPPGSFLMGDEELLETLHSVTLTKGFWMLETEVTQAMWKSVMGTDPSHFKGAQNPVESVSWKECDDFCKKLSSQLGLTVSLPTEAQWEYACRAGTTTAYSFGSSESDLWRYGNYCDASNTDFDWQDKAHNDGHDKTAPAASYSPNAWGLYDMHGNVKEWCQDWYDYDYYNESPTSDPTGPNSGSGRVNRGGSWDGNAQGCRSARRSGLTPDFRGGNLGFRPVLASPVPEE